MNLGANAGQEHEARDTLVAIPAVRCRSRDALAKSRKNIGKVNDYFAARSGFSIPAAI